MKLDERILSRLDELLSRGDAVLRTKRSPGPSVIGDDRVDEQVAHQWATSVQSLLERVFGRESQHYENFTAQVGRAFTYSLANRAQGVLKAARDDYANGHLLQVRRLVEAELFDDFLEQAEHLLVAGYFQAAAVVAGSVLEDGLRRLIGTHCPEFAGGQLKLDAMNSELAKAGAYSKLVQKRITMLADVRNKAAHGRWAEFTREDVADMLAGVRRVMLEQLG